jgi:8-amino-7-oxononanoate synthase
VASDAWCCVASTPIIPIIVGDDRRAVACSDALLEHGILVLAIRPPTVPGGTARLRLTISALHTDEQLAALLAALSGLPLLR